ncbi:MAG: glycosyltransferase family 4 protein, partial [Planctomycetota bacterium]|nr:glycosyltransferase family 4 protein [Planctomycetota bacterium]
DIPHDVPVIGTVGRLAEIKRQDLLIQAFARLLVKTPTAHLLLVGDGPRRNELERLTADLGVSQAIHFAGYREDRDRLLHAMDIFTLTSRSEGMPLSVLEAWAAGVPVVAAHVGGLPELIDDGCTGILVKGDDPEVWSSVFCSLLQEPDRADHLRRHAKTQSDERYSLTAMSRNYESQYRGTLAERERR